MFGARYFGARYFGARYFGHHGLTAPPERGIYFGSWYFGRRHFGTRYFGTVQNGGECQLLQAGNLSLSAALGLTGNLVYDFAAPIEPAQPVALAAVLGLTGDLQFDFYAPIEQGVPVQLTAQLGLSGSLRISNAPLTVERFRGESLATTTFRRGSLIATP